MRTLITFCFLVLLGWGSVSAQNNENGLVGRAQGAVGSCIGQARQEFNGNIQHSVQVVGSCTVSGFLHRVTFYTVIFGPPCNPSIDEDCHPPLPILQVIATVDLDCSGNVIASECLYQQ